MTTFLTGADFVEALRPFARLGGGNDMQAFHDLEDDVVIYENSGVCITAGDVRRARELVARAEGKPVSMMHFRREP